MSEKPGVERPLLTKPHLHGLEKLGDRLIIAAQNRAQLKPKSDPKLFSYKESSGYVREARWTLTHGVDLDMVDHGTYQSLEVHQQPDYMDIGLVDHEVGERPDEKFHIEKTIGHMAVYDSTLASYHLMGKNYVLMDRPTLLSPKSPDARMRLENFTLDVWNLIARLEINLPTEISLPEAGTLG